MNYNYNYFRNNFTDACINKAKNKIRFINSLSTKERSTNIGFGYFDLDETGTIIKAERGYTKQYKGAKVIDLDKFPPMIMFGREM